MEKNLFHHNEPNECPFCGTKSIIFEKNRFGSIENMKCQKCSRTFKINWTSGLPRPVYMNYDILLNLKLKNYFLKQL